VSAQQPGFDPATPNPARVYDYWLGGKDNFAADREVAENLAGIDPKAATRARESRQFLIRAVQYLAGQGIRQFLDLGAGLPTRANVHELAQRSCPGARVLYVDNDPVVISHARALLAGDPNTTIVQADLRDPADILSRQQTRDLIDLTQPVAVLLVAVLHFIPGDEDAFKIISQLRKAAAAGSYLVMTNATAGDTDPQTVRAGLEIYNRSGGSMTPRRFDQVSAFFEGLELVPPGVVHVTQWVPGQQADPDLRRVGSLCGVGRKPG